MNPNSAQRTFLPGSEWIYYKVYCGVNTADRLLTDILHPISERLTQNDIIDKWFFIRYTDPEPHLRIRFHLTEKRFLQEVLHDMHDALEPYTKNNLLWNVQLASYHRELERYGSHTMEMMETLFYLDSKNVIDMIQNGQNDSIRFQHVFQYIDALITLFKEDLGEKLAFLDKMHSSFKHEFGATDGHAKKGLGKKYRGFRAMEKENSLAINMKPLESMASELLGLHQESRLQISLDSLLSSIVHMSVNRVFQSKQRLYEMVLYDFLHQKTRSDHYRQKK